MVNKLAIQIVLRTIVISAYWLVTACQFIPTQSSSDNADNITDSTATIQPTKNPYHEQSKSIGSRTIRQFDEAKGLMNNKQWQAAETVLLDLIEKNSGLSGPKLNLALVYEQLKNTSKAEIYYRQAMEANALNTYAYNSYGVFLRRLGRFSEAEQSFKQALSVWPYDHDSYWNLGILYDLYMGRLDEALANYQQCIQLKEAKYSEQQLADDADYRQLRGWVLDLERRLNKEQ